MVNTTYNTSQFLNFLCKNTKAHLSLSFGQLSAGKRKSSPFGQKKLPCKGSWLGVSRD